MDDTEYDGQRRERATVALRHHDFRLLWAGEFVSTMGTYMQTVAIAWHLYLLTGSAFQLGALGLFRAIPTIAFALVGGAFADSKDRRRVLIVTQALMGGFSAILGLATATGLDSVALIYALTLLTATASCFDDPARAALIPNLVPRRHLPQALTLNILARNVAAVVGPAVGGVAIATFGLSATYLLDAASFAAVIGALLAMRLRPKTPVVIGSGIQTVIEGLRFVRHNPVILSLMVLDFLATLFASALLLMPIFADEILGVGESGLGLLYSASAAGAVAGGLVLSVLPVAHRPGRMILIAVAVYGAAIAAFGLAPSFPIALAALAVSGVADTVSMTARHTIRQLATPDALRGRVAAVHSVFAGGGPELGNFQIGITARFIGIQPAVILGGALCIALAGVVALVSPRIRDYTIDAPEPQAETTAALQSD
jgi:MFS family permease